MYLDKKQVSKHKKIKITPCILSDNHRLKLDITNNRKCTNSWYLNNSLLNKTEIRQKLINKFKTFYN